MKRKPRAIDLTGLTFGALSVVGRAGAERSGEAKWICRCECGKSLVRRSSNLRREDAPVQSCGCRNPAIGGRRDDITGLWFGRWLVLSRVSDRSGYWHCRCECGTEREVFGPAMKTGRSQGCRGPNCR